MKRIVVGITGASGILYAKRLLDALSGLAEIHIIISDSGKKVAAYESVDLSGYPAVYEDNSRLEADIASGSFLYDAMIIVPCSMKTLSSVANGYADTLLARVADVCLKERRRLILVPRETPYNRIHLTNMLAAHDAGAVIMPASPPLYTNPSSVTELVDMVVARILDNCEIEHNVGKRWQ